MMVNGNTFDFSLIQARPLVTTLIEKLNLAPDRVAIELNGELLKRSAYSQATLSEKDQVEIIHYVGGG